MLVTTERLVWSCSVLDLSRLLAVCAWILLVAIFRVAVLLLPSPLFRPLFFLP